MNKRLNVLLIEDNDDHAELIEAQARRRPGFLDEWTRAACLEEGRQRIRDGQHDLVLLDLSLPDSPIGETLKCIDELQQAAGAPVLVLTSLDNPEVGRLAHHGGAQDYLSKDMVSLQRLEQSARFAIERNQLRTELTQAKDELARTNRELATTNEELARSNHELGQFAYVAAHDLQEPLRTTSGLLQIVVRRLGSELDRDTAKAVGLLQDSVSRMSQLVRDLLQYSQLGRATEAKEVDCKKVVSSVLTDLSSAIEGCNAEVLVAELPRVRGYETDLRVLFQNLIGNALKFNRPGSQPRVEVRGRAQGRGLFSFEVEDNGIGIEPQHHSRIFEIFQRLHTRDQYPGSGIGLSNCARVVQAHGGEIRVSSEPGRGSTFSFTLRDQSGSAPSQT